MYVIRKKYEPRLYFRGTELHRDGEFLTATWSSLKERAIRYATMEEARYAAYDHWGIDFTNSELIIESI